jgi:hypothetical protein
LVRDDWVRPVGRRHGAGDQDSEMVTDNIRCVTVGVPAEVPSLLMAWTTL